MKFLKYILIVVIAVFNVNCVFAQYLEFVENKGQWAKNIAYKGDIRTGAIALKPDGGYRMLQHNANDLEAISNYFHPIHNSNAKAKLISQNNLGLHSHVYEVTFLGANPTPEAVAEKPENTYNNYFIDDDKSKWASGCKIFQAITYKNIYPNIDIRYYTGNGSLKYDFIVHPGGNPNIIALEFDGADDIKIKKGKLEIVTSVTTEKELEPYTFQPTNEGKKEINCSYKLTGNIVSFNVDEYDKNRTLIIDPIKVFATFSGSTIDNWGFTATYDNAGNFYGGGIVFGTGFPVNNGSTFQGGINSDDGNVYDIGIIKFNATGTNRLYATYIGGSAGNDQPHSLIIDANNDLIIAGRTNSSNYPKTFPIAGSGGGKDIIVTKLDGNGNILASRVIGGTGDDGMNIKPKYSTSPAGASSLVRNYGDDARSEVIVDDAGNILLASCTQSTDFFVTTNAFQQTNGGAGSTMTRKQDGVFMKITNDFSNILTSTYLGGNNDDAAFVLALNPIDKNIYIAGGTASTDFPGNKTGVITPAFSGGICDGFIAVLSGDGTQLLKSTYIGTSQTENVYGIQFDKFGFPYIMGTTTGIWPVVNAQFFNVAGKQFICKLAKNLGSYVYSTCFGSGGASPNISPTAFLVDRCENVYVSGWGGSINTNPNSPYPNVGTSGLPITQDALQKTTDGSDFYFFVLERGARSQLYGDFMGQNGGVSGEHVDGGTSRFDKDGIIYQSLCGNCAGPNNIFPTTPGAWSETNKATNCNLAAVKIALNLSGVGAGVRSSIKGVSGDTSGCVPLRINFQDTLGQGISYTWNFGDNSPIGTTSKPDTFHIYQNTGYFKVCVVSIDSSTCNIVDTSCRTMRIRSDSAQLKVTYKKIGDCISNTYEFDNRNSVAPISKSFKSNSFRINFGDGSPIQQMGYGTISHPYPASGFYKGWMALVDTNYCNTPDTAFFQFEIIANVKAKFTPPPEGCLSTPIQFVNQSNGGETFLWTFGDGGSSSDKDPKHLFTLSGSYTVTLYAFNVSSCNKVDSISFKIAVSVSPKSQFSFNPNPPRVNTAVNFVNQSIGAVNYMWTFGDGDTLVTTNKNLPIKHLYQVAKAFNACLTVFNLYNCKDTSCKIIAARVSQLYDVPSAFTPNGDGKNDKVFVRGFGIKSMKWDIYNRWGILMFTGNSLSEGWDGYYKGELQPQDVYHYTLRVEFWDDKQDTKTGDITLLR